MDLLAASPASAPEFEREPTGERETSAPSVRERDFARIVMFGTPSPALNSLSDYAVRMGTRVRQLTERMDLDSHLRRGDVDVVVFDVSAMPLPSHELVRGLRQASHVGIVLLSEHSEVADRVLALEFGADDIITAPGEHREALARIRSLARRVRGEHRQPAVGYQFDDWRLDLFARTLRRQPGATVRLTSREFEVLCLLLENANQPVPREWIHPATDNVADTRAADALVGRLRRKLVAAGGREGVIRPVRSVGYVLAAQVSPLRPD